MERYLPPLVLLSSLAFAISLLLIIPDEDWLSLLVYLPILLFLAGVLYHKGIKPVDPSFPASLFALALILKLIGSAGRYWMVADLYNFVSDASLYHNEGQYVAEFFRQFDFSPLAHYQSRSKGSTNLVLLAGLLYTVFPASMPGSFFFFAGLAFSGGVLFYRSFRLAFPETSPMLYRWIIFFLPSILFWPSSLGKDAWIFFGSGIAAYGLVKYVRQGLLSGLILAGIGLFFVLIIRAHFAGFMICAAGAAYLITFQTVHRRQNPLIWLAGLGILVWLGLFVLPSFKERLYMSEFSVEEFQASYQYLQVQTAQGGSSFTPSSILNPMGLVTGIITVLFRPFPWEAHNAQALVTAVEPAVWVILVWIRRRVFWARLGMIRSDPWIAFVFLYSLIMILAFTVFGNFAILARERTLFLPFFWMLFA